MSEELLIGIIGFDTSHVPAFTRLLNDPADPFHVHGARVVAGYPSFSPDVPSSASRVDGFRQEMVDKWGVTLTASIEELVAQVDAVLLESVDGRRHLAEIRPVLAAHRPVYVDKPLAASYVEAAQIVHGLSRVLDEGVIGTMFGPTDNLPAVVDGIGPAFRRS